jgi:hemoglobin
MIGKLNLIAAFAAVALPAVAQDPAHRPGEAAVDPYVVDAANAGAGPFAGTAMLEAFHGREGSDRIVDGMLDRSITDPRISEIFAATDMVRLRRTLKEQFCYILNGGCAYTGRSMPDAHADIGLQPADMGALVEHLQAAMDAEGVPFRTQNRFLARLAPMRRDVVTR